MIHSIYHNPDSISTENRLSAMLDGAKIFIYIRFELLAFYLWSGTIPQNKIRIRMLIYQLPEFFCIQYENTPTLPVQKAYTFAKLEYLI